MTRFFPASFFAAGAIALGLCASTQARYISEAPSARAAAPAAAPFLFFATTSAALLVVAAGSASDAIARR
jgi:hypothetical protein